MISAVAETVIPEKIEKQIAVTRSGDIVGYTCRHESPNEYTRPLPAPPRLIESVDEK